MSDWLSRLASADLPEPVLERAKLELGQARESANRRELDRYLETLLTVPWDRLSPTKPIAVAEARAYLDKQHVGLERAKLRILEAVAIRTLAPTAPQPLFFFVGPPYTGKSHFAQSIAELLGRPFMRFSLAGSSRESDLRGRDRGGEHAHPGLFVDALIRAQVRDPVIYLDDADHLGLLDSDPVDALLSILDDKRNRAFLDRYLGIPIDLSRVLVILAGQGGSPSPAVSGHMTYVEFPGYTLREKEEIARRFLLPHQTAFYSLQSRLRVSDRALREVIEGWTYEPGVGRLAAQLNALARAAALTIVAERKKKVSIKSADLEAILGPRPLDVAAVNTTDRVGVVNGLAMNAIEGAVTTVEAFAYWGHEEFVVTGSVGPVMRESCQVAWTVVRQAEGSRWALPPGVFAGRSLHLHFPKGGTEKEGPSAGVAIAVAIFSQFAGIPVRHNVALTGELSLEGQVLRIGGLKKKILGAHRAGADLVIIPAENAPDLVDIPTEVRDAIEIVLVTRFEEVLERALVKLPAEPPAASNPPIAATTPVDTAAGATRARMSRPTRPRQPERPR